MTKTYFTPMLSFVSIKQNNIVCSSPAVGLDLSTDPTSEVSIVGSAGRRFDSWYEGD